MALFDDWRDSAFLVSTSPGASALMQQLCGMWLLPRSDLPADRKPAWCDKVGERVAADAQLTHLLFADDVWQLHQRQTAAGQDELLATLSCSGYPRPIDHWHLVHHAFRARGAINVTKWSLRDYDNKMRQMSAAAAGSPSGTTALTQVEELARQLRVMMRFP